MRFIKGLSQETIKILRRIYQQSKYHQVRARAQCIFLSHQRYQIKQRIEFVLLTYLFT
jgi:hypothetical protein